jgi:hypothetical protein
VQKQVSGKLVSYHNRFVTTPNTNYTLHVTMQNWDHCVLNTKGRENGVDINRDETFDAVQNKSFDRTANSGLDPRQYKLTCSNANLQTVMSINVTPLRIDLTLNDRASDITVVKGSLVRVHYVTFQDADYCSVSFGVSVRGPAAGHPYEETFDTHPTGDTTYKVTCKSAEFGVESSASRVAKVTDPYIPPAPKSCDKVVPAKGSLWASLGDGSPINTSWDAGRSWMKVRCENNKIQRVIDYAAAGSGAAGVASKYQATTGLSSAPGISIALHTDSPKGNCNGNQNIFVVVSHIQNVKVGVNQGNNTAYADMDFNVNHACHGIGAGGEHLYTDPVDCVCQ